MATQEQIEQLMADVGPALQPLSVEGMPNEKIWGVLLNDDLGVTVDFNAKRNMLVLECELCAVPEGRRIELYELLLNYNYAWHQTGGSRLSLDGPAGHIMQTLDVSTDGLDPHKLSGAISAFGEEARAWRVMLASPIASPTAPATPSDGMALRV